MSQPPARVLLSLVLATVVALTGCGVDQPDKAGSPGPVQVTGPAPCSEPDVECFTTADAWAVIYPSVSGRDRGTVWYEPGGPGLRLPGPDVLRSAVPRWLDDFRLAVVAEPWLTDAAVEDCSERASAAAVTGEARALQRALKTCRWDDFTLSDEEHQLTVAELERKTGGFTGLYATSFGAARAQTAVAEMGDRLPWAILESAAPPRNVSAAQLFAWRADSLTEALTAVPHCEEEAERCRRDRTRSLHRFARASGGESGNPSARFQHAYALLALAYDAERNASPLSRLWQENGAATAIDADLLQRSASAFTQGLSEQHIPPSLLGYWAGICTAYSGWPTSASDEPVQAALFALHTPCADLNSRAEAVTPRATSSKTLVIIVANSLDSAAPSAGQTAWAGVYPAAKVVNFTYPGHALPAPAATQAEVVDLLHSRMDARTSGTR